MAAKKPEPAPAPATTTPPAAEAPKPQLNAAQKKALFATYQKADDSAKAAEKLLDEANHAKSAAVKAISDNIGKGPYVWQGRRVVVSSRGDTYFLKGDSIEAEVI